MKYIDIISESTEVKEALVRVVILFDGVAINNINTHESDCIIVYARNRESLYKSIWSELRIITKTKSPIIAIGENGLDSSIDLRDKVFEKLWESHAYMQIPFVLEDLLANIVNLVPISNLNKTIKECSDNKGLLSIAFHDLRGVLTDKNILNCHKRREMALGLLVQIKELIAIMDRVDVTQSTIDEIISIVKNGTITDEWHNKILFQFNILEQEIF